MLGTEQGLPSRQIQALAEDADGRIWIGTANGLVRFDGHVMHSFPARMDRPNALATTSVETMVIDPQQQLWVATQGGHLARWQALTQDFQRVELGAELTVPQLELWALAADKDRLWVGSYGAGLLRLDLQGRLLSRHDIPAELGDAHIVDLQLAADSTLWLMTMERRLLHFDPRTQLFAGLNLKPGQTMPAVQGLAMRQGRPWFSTPTGELCTLNPQDQPQCEAVPLLVLPGRARMLLADARGDWVGGRGELLHQVEGVAQRIAFQPGRIGGVPQQSWWTALMDHDRGLWFGSSGGGLLYLPAEADRFRVWQQDPLAQSGLLDGRVRGLARDSDGNVWIGTLNAGLHRLTPANGQIESVALPDVRQWRIWAVHADAGQLWVGHQDGLLRLQREPSGALQILQQWSAEQLLGGLVDLLFKSADGHLWAASMGAGLNEIDPQASQLWRHPFGQDGLMGTEVQQIGLGPDRQLWVATDQGLYARDADCSCWKAWLTSARVDAYAADDDDGIYAFVDGDLVRYQWRDGLYRDASRAPRAFPEFQTVGGMRWQQGALWMAGPQGLYRYWPELDRLESFDTRDGLPTREFSDRPFLSEADGRLWIGSEEGLISVDSARKAEISQPARLRFEQMRVDGPDGPRELHPGEPVELQSVERELYLAVRLNSLARTHAQRFSFRLSGWDEDWTEATALPERRFGALPDGSYTLQVRAWDGNGAAASNTLSWSFKVLPPWWRSPLALLIYALVLVMLIILLERWRLQRRLSAARWLETRRQAEWAERIAAERTTLVAELSHEIRNPLNGVLGMGRLLGEQPLAANGRRYLDLLNDAGQQLLRLLDDMLDWSRLEAGAAPLPLQVLYLQPLLAPTLARYEQQASARALQFGVDIPPDCSVLVDPPRLLQIIENLLSNAFKFTLRGRVEISASIVSDQVELRVRDSGSGMTADQAARLFRPFERVGDERAAPGTGLGLAISRSLAERMGGHLRVESERGVGSCFILTLRTASEALVQSECGEVRQTTVESASLSGQCLLIVEDDPIAREVLQRELIQHGAEVYLATDALSALIVVQQQSLSAALIDWDLPGMSGVELAQILRGQYPQLRLIAVTGRGTPEDLARSKAVGFSAHLVKPLRPQQLLQVLSGGSAAGAG